MAFTLFRRFLVGAAILALAALSASATAFDCTNLTLLTSTVYLSDLAGGSTCQIGDKVFSSFADYMPGVDPSQVLITSTWDSGTQVASISFNFNPALVQVTDGQTMDINVQYLVDVTGNNIIGISEEMTAAASAWAPGADVLYNKNYCIGQPFGPTNLDGTLAGTYCLDGTTTPLTVGGAVLGLSNQDYNIPGIVVPSGVSYSIGAGPDVIAGVVTEVGVQDYLHLDGGANIWGPGNVNAAVAEITNTFTQPSEAPPPPGVPEPATFLLIGAGLLGLGALRRKRA